MPLTDTDLESLATEAAAELGIPGAQAAVLHHDELTNVTTGVASVETGTPVTPETLFQIGSVTKIHTAALVMGLVEEGRIDLDGPVVDQLPGFSLTDPDALRTLTPRHLMSMSSGIDNGPYDDYGRSDDAVMRYVEAVAHLPHLFQPGAGFGYSNASSVVSGRLIQHVTGVTWEEALLSRLLVPGGLRNTVTLPEDLLYRRFAVGHELSDEGGPRVLRSSGYTRSLGPAGGTQWSTASDLVRLGRLFLHDGASLDGQVLAPAVVRGMQSKEVTLPPVLLADWWGLGPYGKNWDGLDVYGHSGTTPLGSSYLVWAPERDLAVATTVNLPELGYPFAKAIFREVFRALCDVTVPERPQPVDGVLFHTARFVGRYAMTGVTTTVSESGGSLILSIDIDINGEHSHTVSRIDPLSPTTFLPENREVDGNRGWALAFVGPPDQPATHLLHGFMALRRVPVDETPDRAGAS